MESFLHRPLPLSLMEGYISIRCLVLKALQGLWSFLAGGSRCLHMQVVTTKLCPPTSNASLPGSHTPHQACLLPVLCNSSAKTSDTNSTGMSQHVT